MPTANLYKKFFGKENKITVLYFGNYDPEYSRNDILISGLRMNGIEVLECRDSSPGIRKFVKLFLKHWKLRKSYDAMIVGFPGHLIVPLAKLVTRKPVIFDAFVSLYDSNVFDRQVIKPNSLKAFYYWFLDWISMWLADIILFDTDQHIKYATEEFGIRKEKLIRILVGAQDKIFYPRSIIKSDSNFLVGFYGTYIPLQGVEFIVEAAKEVESYKDIKFMLIGSGQEKQIILKLAQDLKIKNIDFVDFLLQDKLAFEITKADICLGVFGKTEKTQRVIPNKVYQCAAMKKPIITADTPAIRELFDDKDLMMVGAANPKALAGAILTLKNNYEQREELAKNCFNKFIKYATPKILGGELKKIVEEYLIKV